jgi:hypothetical protein
LGVVQCGGHDILGAWRMASPAPPAAEVWRLFSSLVGHGRHRWQGVDSVAGKREVAVDAGVAWVSCTWSPVAVALGWSRSSPTVSGAAK